MSRLFLPGRFPAVGVVWATMAVLPFSIPFAQASDAKYYAVDGVAGGSDVSVAPQFVSADDVDAFQRLQKRVLASPVPDARRVARAYIEEQLHLDSDSLVVAHFASAAQRARGVPDQATTLTEALMEAFPDHARHRFFAATADAVGGLNGGGLQSPDIMTFIDDVTHGGGVPEVFRKVGRFLWSRTGPGYLYNTFFAKGNVIDTVREDARPLDEAFGIFRSGGFTSEYATSLRLSELVARFGAPATFVELPYVARLGEALHRYWDGNREGWTLLARYEFVHRARQAHDAGHLTDEQYRLVMRSAAPDVPLSGAITLAQLRPRSREGLADDAPRPRRFDINGYTATDIVRFVAADGSEVMYVPGHDPAFVVAKSEREVRAWVLEQARDPARLDALLAHFSLYDSQDGVFWTGVKHGLEHLGDGRWRANGTVIDHANAAIEGDLFEHLQRQVEKRLREDALMQASTAWEAWRDTIDRTVTLLAPLGYIPPLALPVQVTAGLVGTGTGIERGIDGRTAQDRKAGVRQAVGTLVTTIPVGAGFDGLRDNEAPTGVGAARTGMSEWFVRPQRVNGRLGYPLGPTVPPGWRPGLLNRLYLRRDGTLARWAAAEAHRHTVKLPEGAVERADGIYMLGDRRFVTLPIRGQGLRTVPLVTDGEGYRIRLKDGSAGPRVARQRDGTWQLALGEHDYLDGSMLAELVRDDVTVDPRTLHHAATALRQLGSSEAALAEAQLARADMAAVEPLLTLAVGHGFIETLSARLRDPAVGPWTPKEVRLLLPNVASVAEMPLALYRSDGSFRDGAMPDGTAFSGDAVPPNALRLQRRSGGYVVLLPTHRPGTPSVYTSLFAAVAEHPSFAHSRRHMSSEMRELDFRKRMADDIDARSTRPELRRMHRLWIDPLLRSSAAGQALKRVSRLRHALIDEHETLTSDQERWLRHARERSGRVSPSSETESSAALVALLPDVVEQESSLLPAALHDLTVRDPAVLAQTTGQAADFWSAGGRHYVRLRRLDGQMQIVETSEVRDGRREILRPGDAADRGTGRFLTQRGHAWFPEPVLADGFAPMPPMEYAETREAIAAMLPATTARAPADVARIVDSIPAPLLHVVRTGLDAVEVADDGGLVLLVRHPQTGVRLRYATRVDRQGRPLSTKLSLALPPAPPAWAANDEQLLLPIPRSADRAPIAPIRDRSTYTSLLLKEQPVSRFIGLDFADRHIRTLVGTRRLRGMLREDRHAAVVAATSEHVFTVLMPVDAESLGWMGRATDVGRRVAELPAGTIVVDGMFGITASAERYPSLAREAARRWEEAGGSMKRTLPDGRKVLVPPADFVERMLSEPVAPNLWSPAADPISEVRYVDYLRRRYVEAGPVVHAGLDWLETRAARRDYMSYFAPDESHLPTSPIHGLVEIAVALGFTPVDPPSGAPVWPLDDLAPDRPKEPIRSAGG